MKKNRKNVLFASAVSLFLLALLVFVPAASAASTARGLGGDRVVIGKDEVYEDDLYIGAEEVIVDGVIKGDLVTAARTITINGMVEGDLWAAGQVLTVNGEVKDDLRWGGAVIILGPKAQIKSDLLVGGYSLEAQPGSQVDGSFYMGGQKALLAGSIVGDVGMGGESLQIEGTVGGNVDAYVGDPNDKTSFDTMSFYRDMPPTPQLEAGLMVTKSAKIGGNLNYTSRQEASLPSGVVAGNTSHRIPELSPEESRRVAEQSSAVSKVLDALRSLVALVLVGLLLVWLAPAFITQPAARLQSKPLPSLGWGALAALVFPFGMLTLVILVILLAVLFGALSLGNLSGSVVGLGLAVLLALVVTFGLVVTYLTKLVVSYLGGRLILERINPALAEKPVWSVLAGMLILVILLAIPILGGLLDLVVTLLGLGALVLIWRERRKPLDGPDLPAAGEAA